MFDDARFYSRLAEDSRSYGYADCNDIGGSDPDGKLDFENDLLSAMDRAEEYLI